MVRLHSGFVINFPQRRRLRPLDPMSFRRYITVRTLISVPAAIAFFGQVSIAQSASYVAAYGDHRIIVAADSKGHTEKNCDILVLGKYAFAASGTTASKAAGGGAPKHGNAQEDAKLAYSHNPKDLDAMAAEWAKRQTELFTKIDKLRLKSLAKANAVLERGSFAGFDANGEAYAFTETISFEPSAKPPLVASRTVTPLKQQAYCSHPITQELFEDNSERAQNYDAKWRQLQASVMRADFDWRYTQFLIQSTADLDASVSHDVDVLAITPDGADMWLQWNACKTVK